MDPLRPIAYGLYPIGLGGCFFFFDPSDGELCSESYLLTLLEPYKNTLNTCIPT